MDQELMAASAGYVRDSFVMASLDQFSEFEHLERILLDAVCDEPIDYSAESLEEPAEVPEKYRKYQKEPMCRSRITGVRNKRSAQRKKIRCALALFW